MNNLLIRNSVQLSLWVLVFALLFAVDPAWGGEESVVESGRKISALEAKQYVLLEAHEPNRLGWTKDDDDDGFMDFLVSIQHPFAYETRKDSNGEWLAYFAFTGRFGQYLFDRNSSPVVAKRFNPKIFFRFFLHGKTIADKDASDTEYYDVELAHESNGQAIDSQQAFDAVANTPGNTPNTAKDNISRGWDYLGLAGKNRLAAYDSVVVRYAFRKYLDKGFFQKNIEQYSPWEGERAIKKINQVSGIRLRLEKPILNKDCLIEDVALDIETGNSHPFKYVTLNAEFGVTPFRYVVGIPVVFWMRTGYNSDLAQYYRKVTSAGFTLRFESFK